MTTNSEVPEGLNCSAMELNLYLATQCFRTIFESNVIPMNMDASLVALMVQAEQRLRQFILTQPNLKLLAEVTNQELGLERLAAEAAAANEELESVEARSLSDIRSEYDSQVMGVDGVVGVGTSTEVSGVLIMLKTADAEARVRDSVPGLFQELAENGYEVVFDVTGEIFAGASTKLADPDFLTKVADRLEDEIVDGELDDGQ